MRRRTVNFLLPGALILGAGGYLLKGHSLVSHNPLEAEASPPRIHHPPGTPYRFAFVCPIVDNEYWQLCIKGMRKADSELGTATEIFGPSQPDNFSKFLKGSMLKAMQSEPDGILAYSGFWEMYALIERAQAQSIPVICVDSDAYDTQRVAYIGTNAFTLGTQGAEVLLEKIECSGRIAILVSSLAADKEMQVVQAFKDSVSDFEVEIITVEETGGNARRAREEALRLMELFPDMAGMFMTAGDNVTGAARAKKELGRNDLVLIGYDASKENLKFLEEGVINALFVQSPYQMGYLSVHLMKQFIETGKLNRDVYDTGSMIVTAENLETLKKKRSL